MKLTQLAMQIVAWVPQITEEIIDVVSWHAVFNDFSRALDDQ